MRRTTSRVLGRSGRLLVVLVCGALLLTGCGSVFDAPLPGGAHVGKNPITVHARFRDVLDLVPQSTVKIDDQTVGKVTGVKLDGYVADVTMRLPRNVDLPDNARAEIRQTSLLGEKFVSLSAPSGGAGSGKLGNGDVIPLARTGRNPEIEEVFSALSLLLNGGGVGQLKTIASELNDAADGRESDIRSVLDQLHLFMGQLDQNKQQIVSSIEALDRLAISLRKQDGAIKGALDDLPAAIHSIDGQRADLVKTLGALTRLSNVGVRVIAQSKETTINSLRDLAPTLSKLAEAGQDLPDALQLGLTYPFPDEAVGRDPQVARNLHMGDFTNLSATLNVDLESPPTFLPGVLPGQPTIDLPAIPKQLPLSIPNACATIKKQVKEHVVDQLQALGVLGQFNDQQIQTLQTAVLNSIDCKNPGANLNKTVNGLIATILNQHLLPSLPQLTSVLPGPTLAPTAIPSAVISSLGGVVGGVVGGVTGGLGLGRAAATLDGNGHKGDALNGPAGTSRTLGYNSTLGALLLQGVVSK